MIERVLMPKYIWIDRFIIIWLASPIAFLASVSQISLLNYMVSNQVISAILLLVVGFRWLKRPGIFKGSTALLVAGILILFFMSIEWGHVIIGHKIPLDDLTDLRMTVYSPLYGSIIIFILYAAYLMLLNSVERQIHLRFYVRWICCFNLIFYVIWLLVWVGAIESPPKVDILNSNWVAYGALFFSGIMIFYPTYIALSKNLFLLFLTVNISLIFAVESRGAIIGLAVLALTFMLQDKNLNKSSAGRGFFLILRYGTFVLLPTFATILLTFATILFVILIFREGSFPMFSLIMDQLAFAQYLGSDQYELPLGFTLSENAISALSRISSIYYSSLMILDNPFWGVGQTNSYSTNIIGSGVHSFFFLILIATGFLGMLSFMGILCVFRCMATLNAAKSHPYRSNSLLAINFGIVLMFINSIPLFFALIIVILPSLDNIIEEFDKSLYCDQL